MPSAKACAPPPGVTQPHAVIFHRLGGATLVDQLEAPRRVDAVEAGVAVGALNVVVAAVFFLVEVCDAEVAHDLADLGVGRDVTEVLSKDLLRGPVAR